MEGGDEKFLLVKYPNGALGVHPIEHRDIFWVNDVTFLAEDLTWEEANALKKLGTPHG